MPFPRPVPRLPPTNIGTYPATPAASLWRAVADLDRHARLGRAGKDARLHRAFCDHTREEVTRPLVGEVVIGILSESLRLSVHQEAEEGDKGARA